jgi:phosphoenolpyruvate carboxylase
MDSEINDMNFDDFFTKEDIQKESLDEKFSKERMEWNNKITYLSNKLKDVFKISELQTEIYTERQRAVEYYHYLYSIWFKLNKKFRKEYSAKYEFFTIKSQIRFPNERSKEIRIMSEIGDVQDKREAVDNHKKFMEQTIKSIDSIIYGIKFRIELENISRGK